MEKEEEKATNFQSTTLQVAMSALARLTNAGLAEWGTDVLREDEIRALLVNAMGMRENKCV